MNERTITPLNDGDKPMTKAEQLRALADRVEAADGPILVLDRDIALAVYPGAKAVAQCDARISVWDGNGPTQLTVKPYTASIDAAMTLVSEGEHCGMGYDSPREGTKSGRAWAWVRVNINGHWIETNLDWRDHRPPSIPLALCAAALRALAEKEEA